MRLEEAMLSYKKFKRKNQDTYDQYFKAGTGPYQSLVDCSYFVLDFEENIKEGSFSTSIDLYPEDIFADDYEVKE